MCRNGKPSEYYEVSEYGKEDVMEFYTLSDDIQSEHGTAPICIYLPEESKSVSWASLSVVAVDFVEENRIRG